MDYVSCKSIILSDIHLGTPNAKAKQANHFIKHIRAENIILNGDIIDGWHLKRKAFWDKEHTRFIRLILKRLDQGYSKVIYLTGNHDEFVRKIVPARLDQLTITNQYILENKNGKYLVLHGDIFDMITTHKKNLSVLGSIGYEGLLKLNRFYNAYRAFRGKEYFSISQHIKSKVKKAVNHISSFEDEMVKAARDHDCQGIICGHIHIPEEKDIDGIHYLNSGDWVESLTAILEHHDGSFELVYYHDFIQQFDLPEIETSLADTQWTDEPLLKII